MKTGSLPSGVLLSPVSGVSYGKGELVLDYSGIPRFAEPKRPGRDLQAVYGSTAVKNPVPQLKDPTFWLPGMCYAGGAGFPLNEDILSRHILMLGGSGSGKTNTFELIMERLVPRLTEKDFVVVFDTKGEYYDLYHRDGDYLFGNGERYRSVSYTWNIFDEILADGDDDRHVLINARELSAALFHGRGSSTQPFFCNAARDIFAALLVHYVRSSKSNPAKWGSRLNNADLLRGLKTLGTKQYIDIFSANSDMQYLLSYFGKGDSNQALGVFGELNSMVSDYFIGILGEHNPSRSISMREAVRRKGGRMLFVEYDLSIGETLAPVYRLLFDQVLKEALSRQNRNEKHAGNVYVITDEFKLLPQLQHIDDALNYGRSLGVKVIAGIQSIDQLYEIYGKDKGAVIASGFGSMFAFYTNDNSSRSYISERSGSNVTSFGYYSVMENKQLTRERDGMTVENWDQMALGLGQAFISLGNEPPFLFKFDVSEANKKEHS